MKLIDIEFEKADGVVDEAPKSIQITFLFEIKKGHIHRIPMFFRTGDFNHMAVIQHLHNFIYKVVSELE